MYGSDDMSKFAIEFRKTLPQPNHRGNVAVFEYIDEQGNLVKKAFTTEVGNGTHAEQLAKQWFETNNIPKINVKRIYSELEPCELGSQCKKMLNEEFQQAQKSYSFEYPGADNDSKEIIQIRRQSIQNRYNKLS